MSAVVEDAAADIGRARKFVSRGTSGRHDQRADEGADAVDAGEEADALRAEAEAVAADHRGSCR
jgi:hypothetical protein